MNFKYSQSTGKLTHDGELIATGYSGHGDGVNNPAAQAIHSVGPVPQGLWEIGAQMDHTSVTGHNLPLSMRLTPQPGTETFGRSGFLIHGDNVKGDRSASQGCIILPRDVRNLIAASADKLLEVTE